MRRTPEVKEAALRRYVAGDKVTVIAAEGGFQLRLLYRWIHAAGLPLRGRIGNTGHPGWPGPHHPPEIVEKAVALYLEIRSAQRVADILGINERTVARYVRAAGHEMSRLAPGIEAAVVRAYLEIGAGQAAKTLGVSRTTVLVYAKKAGIPSRPVGRPRRKGLTIKTSATIKKGEEG